MVKAKSPIISEISQGLQTCDIRVRKNRVIELAKHRYPRNPRTTAQTAWRTKYGQAVGAWRSLTPEQREYYNSLAKPLGISGWNYFFRQSVAKVWLSGWTYRKKHTINPASGAGTGYQIRVTCHYGTGTDNGEHVYLNSHSRTDFGDVRFTASDGQSLLDYWMESKVDGDNAIFWVEVQADLSTQAQDIYVYYGNTEATYAGDGNATFLFFDDFESYEANASLPTTKWPYQTAGWKIYLDGTVKVARYEGGTTNYAARAINSNNPGSGFAVETRMKSASDTDTALFICASNDVATDCGYGYFVGWFGSANTAEIWYFAGEYTEELAYAQNAIPTTYERITVTHASNGLIKLIRQGAVLVSATDTRYTSGYVGMLTWGDLFPAAYFDWIAVRKLTDPEPSHGAWGSEET